MTMNKKKLFAIVAVGLAIPAIAFAADPAAVSSCCHGLCAMCCTIFGTCPNCP